MRLVHRSSSEDRIAIHVYMHWPFQHSMVEHAKYDVVRRLDKAEIRQYPRLVIAKVEGLGDGGFDILYRFITGQNRQKSKVQMTAPVISEKIKMTAPVLSDASSLAFVMPESYTLETTPDPVDGRVKVLQLPERFVAALRFSGRWSEKAFEARSRQLLEELARNGVRTKGAVFTMLYNPPFTPWFMRRNEVAVEIEPS